MGKFDGSDDISFARQQAAASAASQQSGMNNNINVKDNVQQPALMGHQPTLPQH